MIGELAAYEREPEAAQATAPQLKEALFGPQPAAFALIAEDGGAPVGFALWFRKLLDVDGHARCLPGGLVRPPEARGGGHGKALLAALAEICVAADTSVSSGQSWIGMNRPSVFTGRSALSPWTNGRSSGSLERHCTTLRAPRASTERNRH